MTQLYCKTPEELQELLSLDKLFQAKIVRDALIKGVTDFNKMTSLPKEVRERLSKEFPSALTSRVLSTHISDSAIKLALELEDSSVVETVRLSDGKGRYTACLSSQVGCAMGCAFCSTGTMGLVRNLTSSEIIEEYIQLEKLGNHISHIVFMGMGEPLANFKEVIAALTELHREDGLNISYRRITVSTCGLVPGIKRLSELNLQVKLAVSLVAATNEVRDQIMKINHSYPLQELKKALISFQHKGEKRITLEYCMLSGINTREEDAKNLSSFIKGLDVLVNLISWNAVEALPFKKPSQSEVSKFTSYLKREGIKYTIRKSKGEDENAACGQLASKSRRH